MTNFNQAQSLWNSFPKAKREAILKAIHRDPIYLQRAYAYIPKHVREDLQRHFFIRLNHAK